LYTGRGTKRRLRYDQDDEITDDLGPQKRKRSGQISLFSNGSARSGRPAREPAKHSRHNDTADDERPPKWLLKARSGGILPQSQKITHRNTQSRGSAITHVQASTSNYGPNRPKRPINVPNNPYDTCDTTRRSRRLAGNPPEFGMVRERRGASPLYEDYLQEPPAGSRRSQQPVKGAKPQGISKARETKTGSAKRLAKQLRG